MAFCKKKDQLIDLLKDFGYCPVALPREGIIPQQVIEKKKGSYEQTTHLKELFIANKDYLPPALPKPKPALDIIRGKQSSITDSKTGIKLLEKWISALGGNSAVLEGAYSNTDKFVFAFDNAKVRQLDMARFDKYINNAKLDFSAKAYIEKIKRNEIYTITSTLLSNSFTVQAIDKSGMNIKSDINAAELGDINVAFKKDLNGNSKIQYNGKKDLIFGIKAVRLRYEENDQGEFFFNFIDPKRAVLRSGDEAIPVDVLTIKENFLDI